MSRDISGRLCLTGTVTAVTPLQIGASGGGDEVDLVVQRAADGRPLLPGTSFTGALRASLRRWQSANPDKTDHDWGDSPLWGEMKDGGSDGWASFVVVDDAVASSGADIIVRDNVALDRVHGSAVDNRLFTRETVRAGACFNLRITVEKPANDPAGTAEAQFEKIIELLSKYGLSIGAFQGRGLGRVRLTTWKRWSEDWSSPAGMTNLLREEPAYTAGECTGELSVDPWCVRITIPFTPIGSVMSTSALTAAMVDHVPTLTTVDGECYRLLLAGSGVRGALGSHVERLARTLKPQDMHVEFDEQIASRQSLPGVVALLGLPGGAGRQDESASADDSSDPQPRDSATARHAQAGALGFADCLGTGQISIATWAELLQSSVDDTVLKFDTWEKATKMYQPVDRDQAQKDFAVAAYGGESSDGALRMRATPHVAIDRWTGGAADARLFQILEPVRTNSYDPLQITIDTVALGSDNAVAWGLLLAAIRDLTEGQIPLGGQTTRGLGGLTAKLGDVTIECGTAVDDKSVSWRIAGTSAVDAPRTLSDVLVDTDLLETLNQAMRAAYSEGQAA